MTVEPTIQRLDIAKPKLTLTPTRITIKIPADSDAVYEARIVAFAKSVANRLGTPTQSLRGRVFLAQDRLVVCLKKDNHKIVATFEESV